MKQIVIVASFLPFLVFGQSLPEQAQAILKENCHSCHGAAVQMSKLDLRTRRSIMAGGERGPAVEPANLQRSHLFQFVTHAQKPTMPPGTKLSDGEIDILRRWILAGAEVPAVEVTKEAADADRQAAMAKLEERPITDAERKFWSFQPPRRVEPPSAAQNPVDAFLAANYRKNQLSPSPKADRRVLVRRAYLDLLGLPPTPEEVAAFTDDTRPDAWPRLVDKLLASPHYGERQARFWLDLVRYADSGGFERDTDRPQAWRYRDYVVDSFNTDKPYDRFVREQIAGDEVYPGQPEAMIATGYLRLGAENNIRSERTRMDELDDIVATTSLAYLGLTVGCARCHNHKFDPIPQKDYYQIQSVFFSTKSLDFPLVVNAAVDAHKAEMDRIDGLEAPLKKQRDAVDEPYRKALFAEKLAQMAGYLQTAWRTPADQRTEGQRLNVRQIEETLHFGEKDLLPRMTEASKEERVELTRRIDELEKSRPAPFPAAMAIGEEGRDPLPSYFLYRGSPDAKGSLMQPGIVSVAWHGTYSYPQPPPTAATSHRRRGFAEWVASEENPLTARVMVNRLWAQHFGEGIVRTPSNFGRMGARPSHPELLDYLATSFMANRWSVKSIHRLIMTSDAYQMASDDIAANVAIDPENRQFWRMPRQRLQAEAVRDQILAVAGTLDRKTGGPCVFPYINPDLFQSSTDRIWKGVSDENPSTWRRSIYVFTKRSIRYPFFEAFDQPDPILSCDRRNRSTIAPQALMLMNNELVLLQSRKLAARVKTEAGDDVAAQITRLYQLALSRPPEEFELSRATNYIKNDPDGLVDFSQMILNLSEFVYRP
jgi:mono/diheme cytochrome c family protein